MLDDLSKTLRAILDDQSLPPLIFDAEVAFERPGDTYSPDKPTINLFLYDVREQVELRSSEPLVERQHGVLTITQPPLRLACSYQVTAWNDPTSTGEQAILDQHRLLGEALRVFSRMSTIEGKYLRGELANPVYPVSLVTAQADLVRNPAEFWTAMGGKLRPSFTVTASVALSRSEKPIQAWEVSTRRFDIHQMDLGVQETVFRIQGKVQESSTKKVISEAVITLAELGTQAISNKDGLFSFFVQAPGRMTLTARKDRFSDFTAAVEVPGNSPTSFDIEMTELN